MTQRSGFSTAVVLALVAAAGAWAAACGSGGSAASSAEPSDAAVADAPPGTPGSGEGDAIWSSAAIPMGLVLAGDRVVLSATDLTNDLILDLPKAGGSAQELASVPLLDNGFPGPPLVVDAHVYFATSTFGSAGTLRRVSSNGGPAEILAEDVGGEHGIARSPMHVFWSRRGADGSLRLPLAGGGAENFGLCRAPFAVLEESLFCKSPGGGLHRVSLVDGVEATVDREHGTPFALSTHGGDLWMLSVDENQTPFLLSLYRYAAGEAPGSLVWSESGNPQIGLLNPALAIDDRRAYFVDLDHRLRAVETIGGASVVLADAALPRTACLPYVAVDESHVYFADFVQAEAKLHRVRRVSKP
jgi:hypothetical protein